MVFSVFKNLINIDKLIEAKVADTVKNQVAEQLTVNTDNSKQLVLINQNINNLVGADFQHALAIGLQNGNQNLQLLSQEFQKISNANSLPQELIETKLQDPENIVAIIDASKASYTETNIEKRKILADLLFNKINTEDDFENLVLSQAIKTMTSLTEEHLKLISLIFLLYSGYILKFVLDDELNNFFNKFILPLINIDTNKVELIGMGLYTAGCATAFSWGSKAFQFFPRKENQSYDEKRLTEAIKSKIDKYDELAKIWEPSPIQAAHLTAVGKCIGQKYLELKTGIVIDWEKSEEKQ